MEAYWLLAEGAAIAGPTAAAAGYALTSRRKMRQLVREPLFWEGGRPVTLSTLFAEFNGEADLSGSLRELLGGQGPLGVADLEAVVRMLQGDRARCRKLMVDLACDAVFKSDLPPGSPGDPTGMQTLQQLNAQSDQLGFFAFVSSLNELRGPNEAPLLPVESVLVGGLPLNGGTAMPGGRGAGGMAGLLEAIGLARQGGWLPVLTRAVEEFVRDWHLKKARDQFQRSLTLLGAAVAEALKRSSPSGAQLRKNVFAPVDAYMNRLSRARAHKGPYPRKGPLAPSFDKQLWQDYVISLQRATVVVRDKCAALERVLAGHHGHATAGEVLYRHREALLAGVASDALPIAAVEVAEEELKRSQEQADTSST